MQKKLSDIGRINSQNPNNAAFWQARGYSGRPENWKELFAKLQEQNAANAKNPNHEAYWRMRGYSEQPKNWRAILAKEGHMSRKAEYWFDRTGGFTGPLCADDY